MIKVSYITAHKGEIADLRRCLRSVQHDLAYTKNVEYEHLVCFDGYLPSQIPEDIFQFPGVKVSFNKENMGQSVTKNSLLKKANGDYIFTLDSDDWNIVGRTKRSLQKHLEIGKPRNTIIGTNFLYWNFNNTFTDSNYPESDLTIKLSFWLYPHLLYSSLCFHRSLLYSSNNYFNENLVAGQDYELYSRLLQFSNAINLPEALVVYNIRNGGIGGAITSSPETRKMQINSHTITLSNLLENPYFNISKLMQYLNEYLMMNGRDSTNKNLFKREVLEFVNLLRNQPYLTLKYFPNYVNNQMLANTFQAFADNDLSG